MKSISVVFLLFFAFSTVFGQDTKEDLIIKKLEELQKALDKIDQSLRKDIEDNKKDINELKLEIQKLKKKTKELPQLGVKATQGKLPPTAEIQYGQVKLTNKYFTDYVVNVNDKKYTVKANSTLTVDVNPGDFTYQVVGITDLRKRKILAKETYFIEIYPLNCK